MKWITFLLLVACSFAASKSATDSFRECADTCQKKNNSGCMGLIKKGETYEPICVPIGSEKQNEIDPGFWAEPAPRGKEKK